MLISYKLIVYALLIVLAIICLAIYFKRKQRTYNPIVKKQLIELTDEAIDHLEKSKKIQDPILKLQEISYAYGIWNSVKKLTLDEDLPHLVDVDVEDLNNQIKIQMKKSTDLLSVES